MGKLKDRYIRFDWAIKRMLRDKANFAVLEGLLTVLFLQPYIFGPVTEALFGCEIFLAWPWWCPIGVSVSLLVCLSGKPDNKTNLQAI